MNVKHILNQYEHLESRRYAGCLDAVDTLLDLWDAIEKARLTPIQSTYLHLYYVQGYTGNEIGELYGTGRNSVGNTLRRAETRIQAVYDGWAL